MRPILSVALMLQGFVCRAQGMDVVIDTIRAVQPWGAHSEYSFPFIRIPAVTAAATRINDELWQTFLGSEGADKDEPLSAFWGPDDVTARVLMNDFQWDAIRILPNVLTIRFAGEYCAANCEGFTTHYSFDLRSRTFLEFELLFTADGGKAVLDSLDSNWRSVLAEHLQDLRRSKSKRDGTEEEVFWQNNLIEMFELCAAIREIGDPPIQDIIPMPDRIRFVFARCSSHVYREADDLDPLGIDLYYGWLTNHFTSMAKTLLAN